MTKLLTIAAIAAALASPAAADDRLYDARGRLVGTSTPIGDGSRRFYDAHGRSLGTSTTVGGTTTIYGPDGRVVGREVRR